MRSSTPVEITREDMTIHRDSVTLACRLSLPTSPQPVPTAVFVHGLSSSKESPRNLVVAERLLDTGIAALLFDLSGHGGSSPDPQGEREEAFVRDLGAVIRWAAARPELDSSRMCIAGSSLGAVVALEAVQQGVASPAALVLRAPPIDARLLEGVDLPTLIIVGTNDLLLPNALEAAAGHSNVTVETVEGAGHLFDEPGTLERAAQITTRWLREQFHL